MKEVLEQHKLQAEEYCRRLAENDEQRRKIIVSKELTMDECFEIIKLCDAEYYNYLVDHAYIYGVTVKNYALYLRDKCRYKVTYFNGNVFYVYKDNLLFDEAKEIAIKLWKQGFAYVQIGLEIVDKGD